MREYTVLAETDSLVGLSHSLGCLTRWVVSLAGEIRHILITCCEYASAVRYSLLNGRKQRVLYQGLCNQHLMIRWYDQSLLVITTKEGRGYI
jgi:hypothetical protein